MVNKHTSPRILFPRSISQALEMSAAEPEAVFWAGGTGFFEQGDRQSALFDMPRVVIVLGMVEELARASRSENSLEIGAMMSLDRLAAVGRVTLPAGLAEALSQVGTRPLRCRATVGGHLARKDRIGDLVPLLQLLETKIEIRYLKTRRRRRKPVGAARKVSLAQLDDGEGLKRGQLITRASIPTERWDHAMVECLPPTGERAGKLVFTSIARVGKGVLDEWRMALSDGTGKVLRNREMEADMAGRPLPLSERDLEHLDEAIHDMTEPWKGRTYDRETASCLARGFFRKAGG